MWLCDHVVLVIGIPPSLVFLIQQCLGGAPLEEYILPLMVQALTDPEETVVERVLRSFSSIAQLGLFQRATLWELVDIVARFTMHPNTCIREAAAQFVDLLRGASDACDVAGLAWVEVWPRLHVLHQIALLLIGEAGRRLDGVAAVALDTSFDQSSSYAKASASTPSAESQTHQQTRSAAALRQSSPLP